MSILSNFTDLIEVQSDLNPYSLNEVRSLTSRISVVGPTQKIHYSLLDKKILRLAEFDSVIYDLDITGLMECETLQPHLERLAFRLGKTFKDPRLTIRLNTTLQSRYTQFMVDSKLFYLHKNSEYKESDLKDWIHKVISNQGTESLDKMMINSLFGEVFYWRE